MTDAEWELAIDEWIARSIERLRRGRIANISIEQGTFEVCKDARELGLPPLEAWDHLIISYPGLLGDAGYPQEVIELHDPSIEAAWLKAYDGCQSSTGVR